MSRRMSSPEKILLDLISANKGVALGESHGDWNTIEFVTRNMHHLAECGVKHLYLEMIPIRYSAAVEHFNETGNYKKEFPLRPVEGEPITNRCEVACVDYALNVWDKQYPGLKDKYLAMIQAAHDNGIKVIGIDAMQGASRSRLLKSNPYWANEINKHNKKLHLGEKFIVYGGYNHLTGHDGGFDPCTPVNQLTEPPIPSIRFDTSRDRKPYTFHNLSQQEGDYVCLLPESPEQPSEGIYSRSRREFDYPYPNSHKSRC